MTNGVNIEITPALEDYLETIFEIISSKGVARVKDIAAIRNVKPGSVSPALKRLSESGYIIYNQGEFVTLTEKGSEIAVKTITRHKLLYRFLVDILHVDIENAERDACLMEHSLSDSSVNKLTSFFEFFQTCPEGREFLRKYSNCPMITGNLTNGEFVCTEHLAGNEIKKLSSLLPGEEGVLTYIQSDNHERERLINLGFIPGIRIFVEKKFAGSETMTVKLDKNITEINVVDAEVLLVK